ncbi:MAG: putative K(+)-stimulated pyrophosphate-energized sodium pump [Chloroflexi bacterium]|nr:putative K(+)-stimulated pyrophosphate-energized sodium pump [Chloroflexota bacterium]
MDFELYSIVFIVTAGAIGLVMIGWIYFWLNRQDAGTDKMKEFAHYIQLGANAFLRREFITIVPFIVVLAIVLLLAMPEHNWQTALGFITGAAFSLLAIFIGMNAATRANVRTTNAARSSVGKALTIAFRGGSVMGLSIVTFNMFGILLLMWIFGININNPSGINMLAGFGFGASLSALFAQLGGGIYTKAADIGADLVGKVEEGVPEDDPRNAAVIADLVGDNVGDCAGRGADLFESGADNVITTMIVAASPIFFAKYGWTGVLFPLIARAIGILATIIGIFIVQGRDDRSPIHSVNLGFFTTAVTCLILFYITARWLMEDVGLFWAQVLGMVGAVAVVIVVQYYTGYHGKPVRETARYAQSGAAVGILQGFAYGLESTVWAKYILGIIILLSYFIGGGGIMGIYYIAAATMGIKEMKGIIMAGDTFGPIADNAAGISEMSGLGEKTRAAGDALDAVGNVTKALAKGYAMSAATMGSMVILFAYLFEVARLRGLELTSIDDFMVNLVNPPNVAGLFAGVAMPYLFSAQTLRAVNKGAHQVIEEVRRQFREIPNLLIGQATPDYARCVDLTTKNALQKMITPTIVSMIIPIIVGFTLGPWALAAYLIGVKASSAALSKAMFNTGGTLDNAKKLIEAGAFGGKGSKAHAAAVAGDTFGDPLKDTAGPSLHILVKLQNIMSITLLPLYIKYGLNLFQ